MELTLSNTNKEDVSVHLPDFGISLIAYKSKWQGDVVVHIDTHMDSDTALRLDPTDNPTGLRVNVNDGLVFPVRGL